MYKAILWDNDGILVETEKWYFEATKKIMEKEGYKLTLDTYREYFLKNNNGAWHLLKNTNTDYIRALRNKRNELYSIYLKEKHIFTQDMSKLLSSLNSKYKMGIVTSSRKDHFDIIHNRNNLLQYFNFVITPENFTKSKPDPEPYLVGIDKTGYKASECVAIEDSERGVIAAKNANLFCIAVPNEMTNKSDFSKADIILDNINKLTNYLN